MANKYPKPPKPNEDVPITINSKPSPIEPLDFLLSGVFTSGSGDRLDDLFFMPTEGADVLLGVLAIRIRYK